MQHAATYVRYDLQYNECLCAWMKPCLYKQAASDKTWQNATQKGSWMEEFDGLRFFMGLPLCLNSIRLKPTLMLGFEAFSTFSGDAIQWIS
jgi:hypothetical protein